MLAALATSVLLAQAAAATSYNFATEYTGSSFFDGFSYYGYYDNVTNGT
jgi:hypothetical protein